jgi:glycosyltransferase involved in cell wall biosynthesis
VAVDTGSSHSPAAGAIRSSPATDRPRLRIGLNLLTENPREPSGAHWCWTRIVPEMANRLLPGEELHLMVSPAMRRYFPDHGDAVHYLTFPFSNEHRVLRTASEHLVTPFLLPLHHIDLLSTAIAPVVNPTKTLVIHMKTMHAFTAPDALEFWPRTYRRLNYQRSIRRADLLIVNSKSLQAEIDQHLHVDPRKVRLIHEAVDHDIFKPGDRDSARAHVAKLGVTRPFVLFVSSLWRYKNCEGLLHAWRLARDELEGRQLVIVGAERDQHYAAELRELVGELGIGEDVVFVGAVPNEETVHFYRAADLLVYPSLNETFGLPILEAMACACPVVTSSISSMPEVAGGAAILADPHDPSSIARSMLDACGDAASRLRTEGLRRAQQFTWAVTAQETLDAYREAAERRH